MHLKYSQQVQAEKWDVVLNWEKDFEITRIGMFLSLISLTL